MIESAGLAGEGGKKDEGMECELLSRLTTIKETSQSLEKEAETGTQDIAPPATALLNLNLNPTSPQDENDFYAELQAAAVALDIHKNGELYLKELVVAHLTPAGCDVAALTCVSSTADW